MNWCFFGFHKYTKWTYEKEIEYVDDGHTIAVTKIFNKKCLLCNIEKYKEVALFGSKWV